MSSGIFRISFNTVPAFCRRTSSFSSLSSAQLVVASSAIKRNNAPIAHGTQLAHATTSISPAATVPLGILYYYRKPALYLEERNYFGILPISVL